MATAPPRSLRVLALLSGLTVAALVALGAPREQDDDWMARLDRSDPAIQFALELTEQRAAFVRDFVAQGRDPRELPLQMMEIDSWDRPMTLERAQKEALFVIQGHVLSTTYVAEAKELGHTHSLATVQVDRVVKGRIRTRTVEILQGGGPEWDSQGGTLWQLPGDPLLYAGDHVILLLVPARSEEQRALGRYQTVYEAGIYLVTDAGVFANTTALAGVVSGRSPDEVLALFE